MLPYLIAGVIGYGISKLFEDNKAPKYNDGGLIAPNGKPSNLTPEQYKLVRTKAFKDWFGDWENDPENASKVVDENGEPMVVFRGSKSKNPNYIPHKHELSNGIYFSTKKDVAELYTTSFWQNWVGRIFECFLNIRNLDYYDTLKLKSNIYQADFEFYNKLVLESKKNNFDGICWDNFIDVPNFEIIFPKEPKDYMAKTFIVFETNQIKLADGTNTTFDGNNPDIRFMAGGINENNNKMSEKQKSIKSYLESEGFTILNNGIVKYGDIEFILFMQRKYIVKRGEKYMVEVGSPFEPNDSNDYGLKIAVLDNIKNLGELNKGSASVVLDKIIEASDKTETTLQLFPQKQGKKGISTKQLTDWYSKRGFVFINDDIMQRKPNETKSNNPDIRFDGGGNIDDVLDKMLQGEELSQEDKNKMSLYQKHLLSGENDNTFEYHRVSELNIADTNSEEHINKSQIVVQFEYDQKIDVKYMLKKIALTLKKSNIDSVVGFGFKMLAYIGYFVEVNEYDIEKAMSVLKNIGFNVTMNPYYNTLYFLNEVKDDIKFQKLSENPDIIILSNSEIYQKLNLTDAQSVTRLTKLLKNFGITSYFIMKNQLTITDKSKINDLINYLNSKGYNAIRFKKRR